MSQQMDPNLLRRQREKREADKKAKAAAEATTLVKGQPLDAQTRQKAIEARIQDLLNSDSD